MRGALACFLDEMTQWSEVIGGLTTVSYLHAYGLSHRYLSREKWTLKHKKCFIYRRIDTELYVKRHVAGFMLFQLPKYGKFIVYLDFLHTSRGNAIFGTMCSVFLS